MKDKTHMTEHCLEFDPENDAHFKNFVYEHLKSLPYDRWKYFREIGTGWSPDTLEYREETDNYSQRDLVWNSLMRGGMTMAECLEFFPDGEIIGILGTNPVHFSPDRGIYLWEPETENDPFVRQIWLTFPATPKDWA